MGNRYLEKSGTMPRLPGGRQLACLCSFLAFALYSLTAVAQSAVSEHGFQTDKQPMDSLGVITLESLNASSKKSQFNVSPQSSVRIAYEPSSYSTFSPHLAPSEPSSYPPAAEEEPVVTDVPGAAPPQTPEVRGSSELNLLNIPPPTVRRWHSKANAATSYLDGMEASDVAEILKVSRTGSPIYDGIASVMTVADFGLRHRQQKLREQGEGEFNEQEEGLGFEQTEKETQTELSAAFKQKNSPARGISGSRKQRSSTFALTAADELNALKPKKLGGGKSAKRQKDKLAKDKQLAERKSGRVSLRKVVIDEAVDQYFTDRQWFMQQILAPAFADEFSQAFSGQNAAGQGQRAAAQTAAGQDFLTM